MLVTARILALGIALGSGPVASVALAEPPTAPGPATPAPARAPDGDRVSPRAPPDVIPSLTAAQREQITALRRRTRQQLAPQREQLRIKRGELSALWRAEPPSEATISKKLAELDALRAAMRPVLVKSRLASLALLTREQRQALWRPKRPHECDRCARHMHRGPGDEMAAPHAEWMMPWLDEGDELGLDADGTFELDPTPCAPGEAGPPANSPKERR